MGNDLSEWKNNSLSIVNKLLVLNIEVMKGLEQNAIRQTIQFGLNIRIIIVKENIIGIYEALEAKSATKLTMEINSFYIHLKGMLDNLALIINIKFDMQIYRINIDLNKSKFKKPLTEKNLIMRQYLDSCSDWLNEIKDKRDPIAHGKPLYVPPRIVRSQEELDKLNDINKKLELENDVSKITELTHEWGNAVKFHPYMIQHDETKLEHIEKTVLKDLRMMKELNFKTFEILSLT